MCLWEWGDPAEWKVCILCITILSDVVRSMFERIKGRNLNEGIWNLEFGIWNEGMREFRSEKEVRMFVTHVISICINAWVAFMSP